MATNNSNAGLYLGIFSAVALTGVVVYLAVSSKKSSPNIQSGSTPKPPRQGGSSGTTPRPTQSQQSGGGGFLNDLIKGIFGGGKDKGGSTFGGGGSQSGGGTKPTTSPSTGNTAQSSPAWNHPSRYSKELGGYVDPTTGEVWDADGKYLGYVDDYGNFLEFSNGQHFDDFGNVYDGNGNIIGYFNGDEFVSVDLSDGKQYNPETGDVWDANNNYLGWYGEDGVFYEYNKELDAYVTPDGGVYGENGEIYGWIDEDGYHDIFESEMYQAVGSTTVQKSNILVTPTGKMFQTKVNRIGSK